MQRPWGQEWTQPVQGGEIKGIVGGQWEEVRSRRKAGTRSAPFPGSQCEMRGCLQCARWDLAGSVDPHLIISLAATVQFQCLVLFSLGQLQNGFIPWPFLPLRSQKASIFVL